ncbi:MAG: AAA family ATPase [Candidatus Heimdallarchaeota archaeon]
MSKFYGECVSGDTLVFTNGGGLKSIEETIHTEAVHSTIAFNFETGNTSVLPVKNTFDKGIQETLRITAPHGNIEVTPSSRLLTLKEGKPIWMFADDLKIGDQIAAPRKISIEKAEIPLILSYLNDNTLVGGSLVKTLFLGTTEHENSKDMSQKIGVPARKFSDLKYSISRGRKSRAEYVKKLFALYPEENQEFLQLSQNRKVPLFMTRDLMYILGLLAGDGHLRYSSVMNSVTQIILTNQDSAVQQRYFKAIKHTFNLELRQFKGDDCSFYFTSSPIGNLIHNLGIPYSRKSANVKVPPYAITLPDKMLVSYLQGLFDSDGSIQFTSKSKKKGRAIQIAYYSKSKDLVMGIKLCLLRFGILSTLRFRPKDCIWVLIISDVDSIDKFREHISFTQESRLEKLRQESITAWTSPKYDRIPVARWIYEIGKEVRLTHRKLLQHGINPRVRGLTQNQLRTAYRLLKQKGLDQRKLNLIAHLLDMEVIWTPIRDIETSESHVYDFEVPEHHNFVANGLIVHNSEQRVRGIFEDAEKNAPSIIFIDEIDSIAPKREEVTGEVERRVVAQLLALMDGLKGRGKVIVIGATNRPNALDQALRRPGRFDREIEIGIPDKTARLEILMVHTRGMPLAETVDLLTLSERTHGFVGADVAALTREAAMHTLRRLLPEIKFEEEALPPEVLQNLIVTKEDFEESLKSIDPSAMREVLIELPDVHWEDVGGLSDVQQKLVEMIDWPIRRPDIFDKHGVDPPRGILLFGPPGTGKTLLAKAVANESEANFIAIRGPEVLSKWVGESERAIREIFRKAKQAAPCIVFLDEIDSIAPRRGSFEGGSHVTETVVNQLLSSMDGIENIAGVVVIAATNRPDMIDPALLRAGRFDRLILVPSSDENARLEILKIHTRNMRLGPDVELAELASQMEGYVGADIENVCREAVMIALRQEIEADFVNLRDFKEAMESVHPSITPQTTEFYNELEKKLFGRIVEREMHRDKEFYA